MSFGPIMRVKAGDIQIELAPLTRESVVEFVRPGMQQHSIIKYLGTYSANTEEDEFEWYDALRKNQKKLVWGIWVIDGDQRILIGNSALDHIEANHGFVRQATSGSMIFRKEYWGKGIASAAHKARTWYAFTQLGLHRIQSAVLHGNEGSLKALTRSGYTLVYVERNTGFVDGQVIHQNNLECLNPIEPFWSQWWHGDRPTQRSKDARRQTQDVLDWAEQNVELL